MRLWHQGLITKLPQKQLCGQHRECCALRGKGWGKRQSSVDYVFDHPRTSLSAYHQIVMAEMRRRGYRPNPIWQDAEHRGPNLPKDNFTHADLDAFEAALIVSNIFPEHDDKYLLDCLENLKGKGIIINDIT